MKTVFTLIALFAAPMAWSAAAVVGTTANYNVTVTQGSQAQSGTLVATVTAVDATNGYTVHQQITLGSQTQAQDGQMTNDDVNGGAKFLADCANQGGMLEDVTVPKGPYHTCHVTQTQSDGTIVDAWVADVPFDFVKLVQNQNGQVATLELVDFK